MAEQTDTTPPPAAPTDPPTDTTDRAPKRVPAVRIPIWLAASGLGFLAGAGVVGLAWSLSSTSPATPEAFSLTGSLSLKNGSVPGSASGGCAGGSGYSDIAKGASVTVYDAAGKVLATGNLGAGAPKGLDGCDFPVSVSGVPKGPEFYQVEISHRGKINLTKAEAEAGLFAASLG
ncbi:hypothetical protein [Kitasatospora sp. NPDC088548]|uniref:hypothetical protein n=1 Tax=Kitasatospora sp. NPDC088548 TaxID=3364075 RepID=UPI003801C587